MGCSVGSCYSCSRCSVNSLFLKSGTLLSAVAASSDSFQVKNVGFRVCFFISMICGLSTKTFQDMHFDLFVFLLRPHTGK